MRIKFLADENLRRAIVVGVRRREPSISFLQASDIGAAGKDDFGILEAAAREGRILVSHDLRTIPGHFRHFVSQQSSPGVFLVPQSLPLGTVIGELVLLWVASEAEEWMNQIWYLPL